MMKTIDLMATGGGYWFPNHILQSRVWTPGKALLLIPQQAAGYYILRCAGLFPISIYWDGIIRPTNFSTLCFWNWDSLRLTNLNTPHR